jgi:hypothetical protein
LNALFEMSQMSDQGAVQFDRLQSVRRFVIDLDQWTDTYFGLPRLNLSENVAMLICILIGVKAVGIQRSAEVILVCTSWLGSGMQTKRS